MMKAAKAALAMGRPICLFPEGTRVPHGERPPLRAGFAGLYALLKVPVIPVAIDSGRLSPRNSFLKRPGTITFNVGEIIPPGLPRAEARSEEHTSELQSLMRISYAVFCLTTKNTSRQYSYAT